MSSCILRHLDAHCTPDVARAVVELNGDTVEGVVQTLIQDAPTHSTTDEDSFIRHKPKNNRRLPSILRMWVFDLGAGNSDRHYQNYFVEGDRVIPIDHGAAFSDSRNRRVLGDVFPKDIPHPLQANRGDSLRVKGTPENYDGIIPYPTRFFGSVISDDWRKTLKEKALKEMLRHLKKTGWKKVLEEAVSKGVSTAAEALLMLRIYQWRLWVELERNGVLDLAA